MAIKQIKQTRFDGGLTENQRDSSGNKVWYTENVILEKDLVTQTVNVGAVNGGSYDVTRKINVLAQSGAYLYGLGVAGSPLSATIYRKTIGHSSSWEAAAGGTAYVAGGTLRMPDSLFVKDNVAGVGYIYIEAGNYLHKYNIDADTFTLNWIAFNGGAYGGVNWQGKVYFYQGQKIFQWDNVAGTAPVEKISIPAGQQIKQLVPFGNYLAIMCHAVDQSGMSRAYLWDGDRTDRFNEIAEIGVGIVTGGAILNGTLLTVISHPAGNGFYIKAYTGGQFESVVNYNGRYNSESTPKKYAFVVSKLKTYGDFVYFIVSGTRSTSTTALTYEGQIFRFGKKNATDANSLSCWKTLNTIPSTNSIGSTNNDFLVVTSTGSAQPETLAATIYGLTATNQTSYFESSTTFNTTEDTTSNASGIIETAIFNGADSHIDKQLKSVCVYTDPLPTAGTVVLKYRKDNETAWTTIFSDGTDGAVAHAATVIESSGANLPQFREIQFRIELSGNAKLTGIKHVFEELQEKDY